jgi:hypothetical protein
MLKITARLGPPCIKRLLEIAQRDTGGSRRIASVLLSLWSGDQFKCDLQGLLCLDGHLLQQLLALISYLHQSSLQLEDLVSQDAIDPVLEVW